MINISPRIVGIIIISLLAIGFFTFLFIISPATIITLIVPLLIASLLVFAIALIGDDEWPWER